MKSTDRTHILIHSDRMFGSRKKHNLCDDDVAIASARLPACLPVDARDDNDEGNLLKYS